MFEAIGFGVDLVPGIAQCLGEIEFDESVVADGFEGDLLAGYCEFYALLGGVDQQVHFGQLFDHIGRGGGRDPQSFGDHRGGDALLRVATVL